MSNETIFLWDYDDADETLKVDIGFEGALDLRVKNHQGITVGSVYVELHDNQLKAFVWGEDENDPLAEVTILENVKAAVAKTYDSSGSVERKS